MITLKAALIAASAVGTVAAGGGATYALTGSHGDAGVHTSAAKPPAAERKVGDALPADKPTCLPAQPGLPDAKVPGAGVKKELDQRVEGDHRVKDLPKVDVPETGLPDAEVPGAPDLKTPHLEVPDVKGKVPEDLPTCAPGAKELPKRPAVENPGARVPAKPGLPAVPKLDCSTLKPAVKVGSAAEKAAMLTKGLRYASTVPGSAELREQNVCAVTQKWVGKAGQWVTVETLKTPAGMSQAELRKALKLPEGGSPVAVAGLAAWQSPKGGGVLLFDPNGYSMYLDGSPVLAGGLPDMATALRQAR